MGVRWFVILRLRAIGLAVRENSAQATLGGAISGHLLRIEELRFARLKPEIAAGARRPE
jgi:hypothetical protein